MKKTFMKTVIFVMLCVVLSISCFANTSYSWYFKPTNNGEQPQLIPEASGFVKNYDTITIGSPDNKKIYLTFDAGYENGNVEKILNTLKEKNVPGAFFILPQLSKKNVDLLVRMKNEGHLICNHTKTHRDMSKLSDFETFRYELEEAEKIFYDNTGFKMDKFYRPPEGRFSEQNLKWATEMGYTTVFWSLAYADWDNNKQVNPQKALELLISRTHNGCVVLLHPTSATNAQILGDYIDSMRGAGYEFCSINDFKERRSNDEN